MTLQSHTRTIKKYPNRRLYDTEESRYITLSDIRDLVLRQVEFAVIDKKTGENITQCILLQVICEQEQNGEPILSEKFLAQVIRAYGNAASDILADHLEESLALFLAQQNNISRDPAEFRYEQVKPKIP
ncbi:MAG: polyhydroxyalkanoate synthesis repressor PhaR [Woeseiaceae bacterium]|nr:polyhydroxyalkanoate synthesis repressor PhaR [Woeseiaceae bacterium]